MKRVAISILVLTAVALPLAAQIAVRGETIYTMEGDPIHDGVIVIEQGRIASIGSWDRTRLPSGYQVLNAKIVTPGLIDARSTVGLTGYLNQPHDQDHVDPTEPIQPELRAIDAYDSRERLIEWIRQFGVTTVHTGHSPRALVSGQTLIAKTWGNTVEDAVIVPEAMIVATLGPAAFGEGGKAPGTRPKEVALLRATLLEANNYAQKMKLPDVSKRPERSLRLEALSRVISGEMPLLITANRAHDIMTALRIAEEFSIPIIIDGAAEATLVLEELGRSGVRLIVHPPMARHTGELENASFETPARLRQAGIPFALQSGFEAYVPKTRVILFEAAIAAANGLGFEEALASITIDAARILGIADRVGSLAPGKDADLVLFNGDPFEYTSQVTGVIINGQLVESQPH